ncbi:MAG: phosphoenolpyruvate--protein phosphotransferase [Dongiaceae bacterium]
MAEPMREMVLNGVAASEGLAIGRLTIDRNLAAGSRRAGTPADEAIALDAALVQARRQIAALIEAGDQVSADILEFQQALLEDDDLLAPVRAAIASGSAADAAWSAHLAGEIAAYRAGSDQYLSARAEDLFDLEQRVLRALMGSVARAPVPDAGAILVADELTPSRFVELDWSRLGGAAIRGGSRTSHVSILARARGVPLLVGLEAGTDRMPEGALAVLDAEAARLVVLPGPATIEATRRRIGERAALDRTASAAIDQAAVTSGGERIRIYSNVDDPALLDTLSVDCVDGIGLVRTEFLFHKGHLPDEAAQFDAYRRIVAWAEGRPVTIRTLDAGGDKPIAGVTEDGEANPFLGMRGVRLSLAQPELFRVQLRALARAAALGPVRVMVPMVTVPAELDAVRGLMRGVLDELKAEGVAHAAPALGMMVEVPAAALTAERFDADFYSIGSNDLVQYTTAAARDNPALEKLADPLNPAVLELIRRIVEAGVRRGVDVSLCGDMASQPSLIGPLIDCGLRALSVAPAQIGRVKQAVRQHAGRTAAA